MTRLTKILRFAIFLVMGCVVLLCTSNSAKSDVTLGFANNPGSYTPGSSISLQAVAQTLTVLDLNAFSVELTVEAESGTPGVDFFFDSSQTSPPSSGYVFGSPSVNAAGFFAIAGVDGARATLNISDLLDVGEEVALMQDFNDIFADFTIQTTSDVGELTIAYDTTFLELLNSDGDFVDVLQDASDPFLPDFTNLTVAGPITLGATAVPEPSALAIFIAFVAGVFFRRRYLAKLN